MNKFLSFGDAWVFIPEFLGVLLDTSTTCLCLQTDWKSPRWPVVHDAAVRRKRRMRPRFPEDHKMVLPQKLKQPDPQKWWLDDSFPFPNTRCMDLFTYVWPIYRVNVGKYTIHWVFRCWNVPFSGDMSIFLGGNGGERWNWWWWWLQSIADKISTPIFMAILRSPAKS